MRFPGFTDEWKRTTLGEICSIVGGGTPDTTKSELWNGNIQWFTPSEIGKQKYVTNSIRQISKIGLNSSSAKLLPAYSVLLSTRATIGECSINTMECSTNQGFQSLIPNSTTSTEFLYYLAQTKRKELLRNSCGSTFQEISANEVRKIKVQLPTIEEQQKIAGILVRLDERIATQNKIIDNLKKLKAAIIDDHFDGLTVNSRIGDVIYEVSKRNKRNADLPVLSVSNRQGFIAQSEQFENRSIASDDTSSYKIVIKDDFAYNPARINVGSIARLVNYESGIVSPMYICFHCSDEILPEYLELLFLSRYFQLEVEKRLEGSVRLCLSLEGLKSIQFRLRPIPEQKALIDRIRSIQSKLNNEELLCLLYQSQRKYLLKSMFI